jgi:hypothetical protein
VQRNAQLKTQWYLKIWIVGMFVGAREQAHNRIDVFDDGIITLA